MMRSIFFFCCCVASFPIIAQEHLPIMATQRYMLELANQQATLQADRDKIEAFTQGYAAVWQPDTVTIPVVFHVLLPFDALDPITQADFTVQMNQLNALFDEPVFPPTPHVALDAEHFREKSARPGIRFCHPETTPSGEATDGILYLNSTKSVWGMNDSLKLQEKGGSSAWDPTRFLNIWIAHQADGNAGYAQMPGGLNATDGIVIDPDFFARSTPKDDIAAKYQKGRILAHLVGSYLNLYELWDESNPCGDDYVSDTPIHNAPNYGQSKYKHVSTCGDNPVEMTMNVMDMSPDEERYMFTMGQVLRMNAILAPGGPRETLGASPTGCLGSFAAEGSDDRTNTSFRSSVSLRVFPNPVAATLTIQILTNADDFLNLSVFDMVGQLVYSKAEPLGKGTHDYFFDTKLLVPGTYTAIASIGGRIYSQKFLAER